MQTQALVRAIGKTFVGPPQAGAAYVASYSSVCTVLSVKWLWRQLSGVPSVDPEEGLLAKIVMVSFSVPS